MSQLKFNNNSNDNSNKYKIKSSQYNVIYIKKLKDYLLESYYLFLRKTIIQKKISAKVLLQYNISKRWSTSSKKIILRSLKLHHL